MGATRDERAKTMNMDTFTNQDGRLIMHQQTGLVPQYRKFLASCCFLILLCCTGRPLFAQFVVQPMIIEYSPRSGMLVKTEIQLQNWSRDNTHSVELLVSDLTQGSDGNWLSLDEEALQDVDRSRLSSCKDWIELGKTRADVGPMGLQPVKINIHVPLRVKGFYSAAIVARLIPPGEQTGVSVRYDLVIPVMMQIAGANLRHDVTLTDVGLEQLAGDQFDDTVSDTSLVTLGVVNNGNTYSRLHGFAQVRSLMSNDKWRVIAPNVKFQEIPIIPGSALNLKRDLERNLPSGTYKVNGALFVDGRRVKGVEKDIRYEGTSNASKVVAEAVIQTTPEVVFLEAKPNRPRSTTVEVLNQSEKPVNIRAYTQMPELFGGKILPGNVMGEDLACSDWVEVRPAEFQVKPYGRTRIRLLARMPNVERYSFYAKLKLIATYAGDGANAGRKSAMVVVTNENSQPEFGVLQKKLDLQELAGSKYVVSARYANVGSVHINPKVYARAVGRVGNVDKVFTTKELISDGAETAMMLPIEQRAFAGVLDFEDVPDGVYRLEADLIYGSGNSDFRRIQKQIRVWEEDGRMRAAWDVSGGTSNVQRTAGTVSW